MTKASYSLRNAILAARATGVQDGDEQLYLDFNEIEREDISTFRIFLEADGIDIPNDSLQSKIERLEKFLKSEQTVSEYTTEKLTEENRTYVKVCIEGPQV